MSTTTTDTERGLLAAICAEPDDNNVRLVYADYLQEQGDSDRAEFIRVQVELERLAAPTGNEVPASVSNPFSTRESALLSRHPEWLPVCRVCEGKKEITSYYTGYDHGAQFHGQPYIEGCTACNKTGRVGTMRRGFVDEVKVRLTDVMERPLCCPVCIRRNPPESRRLDRHWYCDRCDAVRNSGTEHGEWQPTPWAVSLRTQFPTCRRVYLTDRRPWRGAYQGAWHWFHERMNGQPAFGHEVQESQTMPGAIFKMLPVKGFLSEDSWQGDTQSAADDALATAVWEWLKGQA